MNKRHPCTIFYYIDYQLNSLENKTRIPCPNCGKIESATAGLIQFCNILRTQWEHSMILLFTFVIFWQSTTFDILWLIFSCMTSLPLCCSCHGSYLFFHQLRPRMEHHEWVSINVPPYSASDLFVCELGFMWGAHTHNGSPLWLGFQSWFSE